VGVLDDVEAKRLGLELTRAQPVEERVRDDPRVDVVDARPQAGGEGRGSYWLVRWSIGT
jgi:hypothetical protein